VIIIMLDRESACGCVCVILACGPSRCSQDTKDQNTKTQWHTQNENAEGICY